MAPEDFKRKLTSSGAKYSVILMTAHENPQWQERAKKAGALAYLKKPFIDQSLLDTIQFTCGKGPEYRREEGD
jgi:FixJ family two-component response regulator